MPFVDEHRSEHFACALFAQMVDDGQQRMADIENVIDDEHGASLHVYVRVRVPFDFSAFAAQTVAGRVEPGEFERKIEPGQQESGRNEPTVHDRENERIGVGQPRGNAQGHAIDGGFYRWPVSETFGFIAYTPDIVQTDDVYVHCFILVEHVTAQF